MLAREMIQKSKLITGSVAIALLGLSVLIILLSRKSQVVVGHLTEFYFTDDDGKTCFAGPSSTFVPFDHNGREAVICVVYQDDQGRNFAGYLERAGDDWVAAAKKMSPSQRQNLLMAQVGDDLMVKRPGDAVWVKFSSPAARNMITTAVTTGTFVPASGNSSLTLLPVQSNASLASP